MENVPARSTAVLVLHGFTAQPRTVDFVLPFLHEAEMHTALPVLRGHASAPENLLGVRWQDWVEDATKAFLDLAQNHERVSIVGHSMGAMVAAHMAAQHPQKLHKLVLVSPAMEFSNPAVKLLPILARFVKFWQAGPVSIQDKILRDEFSRANINYNRFPIKAFQELFNLAGIVKQELSEIHCPCLILHGSLDSVIPKRAAEQVFAGLGSQQKQISWLEQSDHEIFWDGERQKLCLQIAQFLVKP